jgi:hypothetical protein
VGEEIEKIRAGFAFLNREISDNELVNFQPVVEQIRV